jgi:hypothetical protein
MAGDSNCVAFFLEETTKASVMNAVSLDYGDWRWFSIV